MVFASVALFISLTVECVGKNYITHDAVQKIVTIRKFKQSNMP